MWGYFKRPFLKTNKQTNKQTKTNVLNKTKKKRKRNQGTNVLMLSLGHYEGPLNVNPWVT